MSKPRKKYNPRKTRIGWAGESTNFCKAFALASNERMTDADVQINCTAMLAHLDIMQRDWSPASFNMISHIYRVARIIATEMEIKLLADACDASWVVLNDLYSAEGNPVMEYGQYQILRYMVDALMILLPELPKPLWTLANDSSRETLKQRMVDQYVELPRWARMAAIDVMSGKTIKELAPALGMQEKAVSEHVRAAGAILYTLHGDASLPFPADVSRLRKMGETLLPVAAVYERAIKNERP